ncbi:MAG: nucleotidyltransferase domain-containing protein [Lachnospiraceae bacterium]|jgi:predicted nucleotidyltransferase|nr:nucleotidyltransferase domain-containing protein [Lachnospiraceae bacterium]
MSNAIQESLMSYVSNIEKIYGEKLRAVILYGSYARGDNTIDSDIDIMILLDMEEIDIKKYRHELSDMTYDYNMEHDLDIKPIAKSQELFNKWNNCYPFYKNIKSEGISLYAA